MRCLATRRRTAAKALVAWLCAGALGGVGGAVAWGQPSGVPAAVPLARRVGEGRLTFLGMNIYDARLWAAPGFDARRYATQPFALELVYLRGLRGHLIARRSIQEMKALPGYDTVREADWLARMTALFPDVEAGDVLVGIYQPGAGARFLFNGQPRGQVDDPLFARLFFGIWLAEQTSEPALRQALLGPDAVAPRSSP